MLLHQKDVYFDYNLLYVSNEEKNSTHVCTNFDYAIVKD